MGRITFLCGFLLIMFCNGLAASIGENSSTTKSVTQSPQPTKSVTLPPQPTKIVTQPPQPSLSAMTPTITPDIPITTEPMSISNYSINNDVTDDYLHDSDEDQDNTTPDNTESALEQLEVGDDSYPKNNTIEVDTQANGDSYYRYNTSSKDDSGRSGSKFKTDDSDRVHRLWTYAGHSAFAILGILLTFFIILNAYLMTQKMHLFSK